jgi:hypothetical protein
MKKRIVIVVLALLVLGLVATVTVAAGGKAAAKQGSISGIRAGVTCHDPCDDPFQLKAWVKGNAAGVKVKFVVKGKTFTAVCNSSGYAHYHLSVRPSSYPQGVVVSVKVSASHGGKTVTASTWFKPNYN